jgi:H+-transporting ATPase
LGYDNVIPSRSPQIWNVPRLFVISIALAIFACGSSLLLLYWALDSWHTDSFMYKLGLGKIKYGQIISMIYLKVSISDFLTLFASRAHNKFFWKSRPATILMGAAALALSASTIVATSWPNSHPDGIETEGMGRTNPKLLPLFVWIYCIIWWFLQDGFKVLVYQGLKHAKLMQNRKVQVVNVNLCEYFSHQIALALLDTIWGGLFVCFCFLFFCDCHFTHKSCPLLVVVLSAPKARAAREFHIDDMTL